MKRIKSLLLGLASGAAFGMLFAPGKGKDLRDRIKKERAKGGTGLNTVKTDLKAMGSDFMVTVQDLTENEEIQNALSKGKEKFYDLTGLTPDDVEDLADKTKKQAQKLEKIVQTLKKEGGKKLKVAQKTAKNFHHKVKKIGENLANKFTEEE